MLDDMIVGDDVAVRRNDEAGALGHADARTLLLHARRVFSELLEEALKRVAGREMRRLLLLLLRALAVALVARLFDHLDLDRDHCAAHAVDDVGE